jgi:hypothetical protein
MFADAPIVLAFSRLTSRRNGIGLAPQLVRPVLIAEES